MKDLSPSPLFVRRPAFLPMQDAVIAGLKADDGQLKILFLVVADARTAARFQSSDYQLMRLCSSFQLVMRKND